MRLKKWLPMALVLLFAGWGCHSNTSSKPKIEDSRELKIAAASNLEAVLSDAERDFGDSLDIRFSTTLFASGALTAQIQQGAPFDLFLTAERQYAQTLIDEDLARAPIEVLAHGQLVLVGSSEINNINDLLSPDIERIAIANPETAPFGLAAKQALQRSGIWEQLQDKLVFGASAAQTNQFLLTGAADAGITGQSILFPEEDAPAFWSPVPDSLYDPLEICGVLLTRHAEGNSETSQEFLSFLNSEEGQNLFKKYNYLSPKASLGGK